jgi:hypothetical protein
LFHDEQLPSIKKQRKEQSLPHFTTHLIKAYSSTISFNRAQTLIEQVNTCIYNQHKKQLVSRVANSNNRVKIQFSNDDRVVQCECGDCMDSRDSSNNEDELWCEHVVATLLVLEQSPEKVIMADSIKYIIDQMNIDELKDVVYHMVTQNLIIWDIFTHVRDIPREQRSVDGGTVNPVGINYININAFQKQMEEQVHKYLAGKEVKVTCREYDCDCRCHYYRESCDSCKPVTEIRYFFQDVDNLMLRYLEISSKLVNIHDLSNALAIIEVTASLVVHADPKDDCELQYHKAVNSINEFLRVVLLSDLLTDEDREHWENTLSKWNTQAKTKKPFNNEPVSSFEDSLKTLSIDWDDKDLCDTLMGQQNALNEASFIQTARLTVLINEREDYESAFQYAVNTNRINLAVQLLIMQNKISDAIHFAMQNIKLCSGAALLIISGITLLIDKIQHGNNMKRNETLLETALQLIDRFETKSTVVDKLDERKRTNSYIVDETKDITTTSDLIINHIDKLMKQLDFSKLNNWRTIISELSIQNNIQIIEDLSKLYQYSLHCLKNMKHEVILIYEEYYPYFKPKTIVTNIPIVTLLCHIAPFQYWKGIESESIMYFADTLEIILKYIPEHEQQLRLKVVTETIEPFNNHLAIDTGIRLISKNNISLHSETVYWLTNLVCNHAENRLENFVSAITNTQYLNDINTIDVLLKTSNTLNVKGFSQAASSVASKALTEEIKLSIQSIIDFREDTLIQIFNINSDNQIQLHHDILNMAALLQAEFVPYNVNENTILLENIKQYIERINSKNAEIMFNLMSILNTKHIEQSLILGHIVLHIAKHRYLADLRENGDKRLCTCKHCEQVRLIIRSPPGTKCNIHYSLRSHVEEKFGREYLNKHMNIKYPEMIRKRVEIERTSLMKQVCQLLIQLGGTCDQKQQSNTKNTDRVLLCLFESRCKPIIMEAVEYMTKDNSKIGRAVKLRIAAIQSMITNREDPSEIIELSDKLYTLAGSIKDGQSCINLLFQKLLCDPLRTFKRLKHILEKSQHWISHHRERMIVSLIKQLETIKCSSLVSVVDYLRQLATILISEELYPNYYTYIWNFLQSFDMKSNEKAYFYYLNRELTSFNKYNIKESTIVSVIASNLITITNDYCSTVSFQGVGDSLSDLISKYSEMGYHSIAVEMANTKTSYYERVLTTKDSYPEFVRWLELCAKIYTRAKKIDDWRKILSHVKNCHGQKKNLMRDINQSNQLVLHLCDKRIKDL